MCCSNTAATVMQTIRIALVILEVLRFLSYRVFFQFIIDDFLQRTHRPAAFYPLSDADKICITIPFPHELNVILRRFDDLRKLFSVFAQLMIHIHTKVMLHEIMEAVTVVHVSQMGHLMYDDAVTEDVGQKGRNEIKGYFTYCSAFAPFGGV